MMKVNRGKRKLSLFLVLALLLGLQLSFLSLTPAVAATPGWFTQYTNETEGIFAVSAVNANVCWALGAKQTSTGMQYLVYKTTNAGVTWTSYNPGTANRLTCISANDANTCWVGGQGIILRTSSGGTSWSPVESTSTKIYTDISAPSTSTCWAVGASTETFSDGFIMKTINSGGNWSTQLSGLTYPMLGIDAVSTLVCWAVGGTYNIDTGFIEGNVWSTTLGTIWTARGDLLSIGMYWDVSAVSATTCWVNAVSFDLISMTLSSKCSSTINGGLTWYDGVSPSFPVPFYHSLEAIDSSTAWMATLGPLPMPGYYTGCVYKTTDAANNWTLQAATSGDDQGLFGLSAVNVNTAWAVGANPYTLLVAPSRGIILHTTDGGQPPLPNITGITPSSAYMGEEVTISGSNFGSAGRFSKVTFADKQASIVSWSDTSIKCKVPGGLTPGSVTVKVTTLGGTSNGFAFTVKTPLPVSVTSVAPTRAMQFGLTVALKIQGSGFQAGARVKLVTDSPPSTMYAGNVTLDSSSQISCTLFLFGTQPGSYDVVVINPDGGEGVRADAFTVDGICGSGASASLLMLGITLGLLSLAGSGGILRRRRRKNS